MMYPLTTMYGLDFSEFH